MPPTISNTPSTSAGGAFTVTRPITSGPALEKPLYTLTLYTPASCAPTLPTRSTPPLPPAIATPLRNHWNIGADPAADTLYNTDSPAFTVVLRALKVPANDTGSFTLILIFALTARDAAPLGSTISLVTFTR